MPRIKKIEATIKIKQEASIEEPKIAKTKTSSSSSKLKLDIYNAQGKVIDSISLPDKIFGVKVNKQLIAQAVRVHLANLRQGTVSTKTRGEVDGSTRKIYRQKGTGRARHGSIRAPIFVHGGIVFGPKPRDYGLKMPKKMKRAALFSALTAKFQDGEIKMLIGLEKIEPKTKSFVSIIQKLGLNDKKKKILLITSGELENIKRAAGNVKGISLIPANRLNTYEVLSNKQLLFMQEAIAIIKNTFLKNEA